jgi:glycosyltransferase involved in cell wall biosynthesis
MYFGRAFGNDANLNHIRGIRLGLTISVAMCTFNGERFLGAQLESIAAQNRPPDELVVCDDGSSDRTQEIVREFSARVSFPVRLEVNEQNLGTTKNFEKAISFCQGAIVALADQDDVWYRHKLARVEEVLMSSPETVAAFSDADLIDANSKLIGAGLWDSFLFGTRERVRFANGEAVLILTKHHIVTGATLAFRRGFISVLVPFQDFHDRWLGFLLAACGKFATIDEPLMQYRRHEAQQFGPGSLTWREQLAQIKRTDGSFYLSEIERFQNLHQRLEERRLSFVHAERAQKEIVQKVAHLERRIRLPRSSLARIPEVFREMLNGDYWRYSAGWKSIAKDLVQSP